jgi:hypothetical protein
MYINLISISMNFSVNLEDVFIKYPSYHRIMHALFDIKYDNTDAVNPILQQHKFIYNVKRFNSYSNEQITLKRASNLQCETNFSVNST